MVMYEDRDPGDEHEDQTTAPPGLSPCPKCKTPIGTGITVHFPTPLASKPCPASFPQAIHKGGT